MSHQLILGTAGHIDHGKTALIQALTGVNTDRLPQEQERGITIDIGFAHLDLGDHQLGIVDVPGHERFIKNMLAGAAGMDIAMLVVAADDSVMPQTVEHLAILRLLKLKTGLIAVTKTDLVDEDWLALVEDDIEQMVEGTFLAGAPIVRTSATTGEGLDKLKESLQILATQIQQDRDEDEPFRLAVDRSFAVKGRGTVVTGTVWSGSVSQGGGIQWLPSGKPVKLRGLQSHNQETDTVRRGQRAALNLADVHHTDIHRGHELADVGYLQATRCLTVLLDMLPASPQPLKHRARVRLHLGTQEVIASVRLLRGTSVEPGERAYAQLICAEPIVATCRQPFVLRRESPLDTIGGGEVLIPVSKLISRRDPEKIKKLDCLHHEDDLIRAETAIFFKADDPWSDFDLCRDADLSPGTISSILEQLEQQGTVITLDEQQRKTLRLHRDVLTPIRDEVLRAVERLHADTPLARSIPRQRIAKHLHYSRKETIEKVIDSMIADSVLIGNEQNVAHPKHEPKLTEDQKMLKNRVIDAFHRAKFQPPTVDALVSEMSSSSGEILALIELGMSENHLVHIHEKLFLHMEWERELQKVIHAAMQDGQGLTVSQIRELLDTSRKFAVPICEYLDRIGLTRREGDIRLLK